MLAKIRRMHFRDGLPLREIAKRTGLSRNTIRRWLRSGQSEPVYPRRARPPGSIPTGPSWRRGCVPTAIVPGGNNAPPRCCSQLQAIGYPGTYTRVTAFIRQWKAPAARPPPGLRAVALSPGEAFQFDWSREYAFVGSHAKMPLDLAHVKLACSRAFWLVAYPTQSHEMLFDAHTQAFTAFGGVPRRGIYDNMKTAVDKVGQHRERRVNARFHAMTSHYLFAAEFCNRAAGWEKGGSRRTCRTGADRSGSRPGPATGQIWTPSTPGSPASAAPLGRCRRIRMPPTSPWPKLWRTNSRT
jgi:transposase